jgi:3-deoxy-D-manno-octulosonate 8-phosphate phosphatase (KDO 8-P phosphatase)
MNLLEQFKEIKTFIFDVDGVLTNSQLLVTEEGQLLRQMNVRDGFALKHAVRQGYNVCIITGGKSVGVKKRLEGLGITDIFLGANDKVKIYKDYVYANELDEDLILYMGDDLPDYYVMRKVGLPVCPADASPEIVDIAKYISPIKGGAGCARDVIEKVLKLNGDWMEE